MPKLDLRTLLTTSLVANSNEPARTDTPDDATANNEPIARPPASPRDSPRAQRGDGGVQAPRPSTPARTHRALRPRRRS